MVEVNVDKFYSNRALYPFIPEAVLMRWKLPTCPGMNVPEYRKGNIIQ